MWKARWGLESDYEILSSELDGESGNVMWQDEGLPSSEAGPDRH